MARLMDLIVAKLFGRSTAKPSEGWINEMDRGLTSIELKMFKILMEKAKRPWLPQLGRVDHFG